MKTILSLILIILFTPCPVTAGGAEKKGLEIAVEADRRSSGFEDYIVDMTMVLRNRAGKESRRSIRSRVLETEDDGDKSLTIFDSPRDVRGTAMLTFTHKIGNDDQWLYLPALKRVKRISSANKSGSFMGSEFAYEDLGSREVEKYTYRYLSEGKIAENLCFAVERRPKDRKNSGYSKIISWLDQKEYRVMKEEYYDKRGRLLKTLILKNYKLYLGTHWRPHCMEMVNHQNGKQTDLLYNSYTFRTGLKDRDFNKSSLKRAR